MRRIKTRVLTSFLLKIKINNNEPNLIIFTTNLSQDYLQKIQAQLNSFSPVGNSMFDGKITVMSFNLGINLKAKSPLNLEMKTVLSLNLSSRKEISRTSRSVQKGFEKSKGIFNLDLVILQIPKIPNSKKMATTISIIVITLFKCNYLGVEQWKGL